MAAENMPPLAALRKKTYEHIANSRDRHPDYARALTLNLLEEQKLRSTMVLLDRQKTAEISKFRLEHRAFLSRAKSATEQLSRESLGESRGIRRPWSEFGMARVQFQSAEARLVHGGGSRAGHKSTGPSEENRSKLRLKAHGFYTHCHHCAKRYIKSAVTAGPEHDEEMSSGSVTPETYDDAGQLADKDRWDRNSNQGFAVTIKIPPRNAQKQVSRPTTSATDTAAIITPPAAKPPRPPAKENGPTAWAGRRRVSSSKTRELLNTGVSKQNPSTSQFTSNGATRHNVTSLSDDFPGKSQDRISTGFNSGNSNSAPSGQHRYDRPVLRIHESLPSSPRGRWFWAYRAVVKGNRSRQREEIPGNQNTPTSKNVAKPTKGTRKKKLRGKNARSTEKNAKYGDKTGRKKDAEKSSELKVSKHKTQSSILPVSAKARWRWAMRAVLRNRNRNRVQMKRESQNSIAQKKRKDVKTASTENPLPCSPKERWVWATKAISTHRKSTNRNGGKKVKSRPEEHLQTASNDRPVKNPKDTQKNENPSRAKDRWLWAMKEVLKQTARRRYNATDSPSQPSGRNECSDGLPSHPKQRWHWAMRAVLKNRDKFEKQEQPSMDEKHSKKTGESKSYSKTKAAKTESPTSCPVTQRRSKRNSTALVNSFLGNVPYTQTASGVFSKPGSKTRRPSVRHRPLKFDPRTLLKQAKEQEKQKEAYEDMMEKFKKLRNCRYLRWRQGQDPYLNDTFEMSPQTRILTLPLPLTTNRSKIVRKPSFRQANRSFFSATVVAVTSVGVSRK